jgi:hypothetical protein
VTGVRDVFTMATPFAWLAPVVTTSTMEASAKFGMVGVIRTLGPDIARLVFRTTRASPSWFCSLSSRWR